MKATPASMWGKSALVSGFIWSHGLLEARSLSLVTCLCFTALKQTVGSSRAACSQNLPTTDFWLLVILIMDSPHTNVRPRGIQTNVWSIYLFSSTEAGTPSHRLTSSWSKLSQFQGLLPPLRGVAAPTDEAGDVSLLSACVGCVLSAVQHCVLVSFHPYWHSLAPGRCERVEKFWADQTQILCVGVASLTLETRFKRGSWFLWPLLFANQVAYLNNVCL